MELLSGFSILIGLLGGICSIVSPVVILGGLGIFLNSRRQQSNAVKQAALSWGSTIGTVLASSVQTRHTGRSHSTFPVVVYHYEASGRTYQGQTIKAGEQFMGIRVIGETQATVARYPTGVSVMVYYNPANAAESALER